ncbi:glycosyltransferase family 9 protein [Actinomycetospora cinnamomea]|uniref:ADP-heptose:LPS heptosyltransferase n=1 Tax=Actinomycetospora cinnamomea TaxID=663609 RepID=A0A2U1EU39_9PSEU|nr:glycosyltransferase family 9 protein [Actinomycetospora cinnamomea]PVZ03463.1 ADP-heptose:LPS heptosyltransferase [Actinomycetospora cinnamomea]
MIAPVSGPALGLPAHPAPPVSDVRRLAVLRANGLGDYVVAEPALSALRAAYPDAELTLLGAKHHVGLLEGRPSPVDRVVTVPLVPGVRVGPEPDASEDEVEAWCAQRRAERYDLAVQLHGGGRNSNKLLLRLGARVTVGAATPDAPRPDRWVPYWPYQHDTIRWLEVAAAAGATPTRVEPRVEVTPADLEASHAVVPPGDAPLLVVHPGATDARRCYPEERLGDIAQDLAGRGARVVVAGGPSEAERVARVVAGMRAEPETAVGTLDLPALVGLLSRATMVLGNDSGPRHLAAAVGTPTVAVFTYANLADVAPLTRVWHRVLVSWRGGCQVCGLRVLEGWCGHGASATHDVDLEEVRDAAVDLWGQSIGSTPIGLT